MKEIATIKVARISSGFGEHAPMATVCCNACRTCVQSNIIGIGLAAIAAAVAVVRRRIGEP